MKNYYDDIIKDALYPKKNGVIAKSNKYIKVNAPKEMKCEEIRLLRQRLHLSNSLFASVFNVSGKTIEAWESGTNTPSGASLRLLHMIKNNPDILFETGVIEDKTVLR